LQLCLGLNPPQSIGRGGQGADATPVTIYDGPKVKIVRTDVPPFAPYQPIIVDRYGRMMVGPTDFLRVKRKASRTNSAEAIHQTGRQLVDVLFVVANSNDGDGVALKSLSDQFLERLKSHFTGPKLSQNKATGCRGVTNEVWNANLSVFLQYLLYCEKRGLVQGLIGVRDSQRRYNIELEECDPFPVHRLVSDKIEPDEVVIPDETAFDAVLAAREEMFADPVIRRRNTLISLVMDEGLRRWEAVTLPIQAIPPTAKVEALRAAAKSSGIPKPVPIKVIGGKTGRVRVVNFSLSLVERIRDFIDDDRPALRPAMGERAIFVSSRNGKQLHPQTITNQYCVARKKAITTARNEGGGSIEIGDMLRVHPHVHRHRCVTDTMTSLLENGIDPLHAMLDVMTNAGMSLSTITRYLHLGQRRRKSVLVKQGHVDKLRDDVVLERLRALDETKLRMISRGRIGRR